MAEKEGAPMRLRSVDELQTALEVIFNQQRAGKLDGKTADGLNTTLKGAIYLGPKLHMEAAKLYILAQKAKIQLPPMMLPEGMRPVV